MSLELMKKRLMTRGGNAEGRLAKEKLETLQKAMLYSYQAETIVKDGEEYRCLINNNKLKMDYDDKVISIPFSSNVRVGDIFYWDKTKENWIVYLQQFSEDAYFRGFIRKAQHQIKWLNEFGKEKEVFAAVRGPVETKIKGEQKSKISYDTPNYSLSIIVPNNEYTKELRRYKKVTIDDLVWEITVADTISEPGVIDLQLIETAKNKDEDSNIVGDLNKPKIKVVTNLDGIESLSIGNPLDIKYEAYVDGKLNESLSQEVEISVASGNAELNGSILNLIDEAKVVIALDIPSADLHLEYHLVGSIENKNVPVWRIVGDDVVKSYGTTKFKISKAIDGNMKQVNGEWKIEENAKLFSIANINSESVYLRWKSGMMGEVLLEYISDDEIVASKTVIVESLL